MAEYMTGVSGNPPPANDCGSCAAPHQGLDLRAAGYHPSLKGTDWLRDKGLGKLRICRQCGRLWQQHRDSREGFLWYADLGLDGVSLLSTDVTPAQLAAWAAEDSAESAWYWLLQVLAARLKRCPDWGADMLREIEQRLDAPVSVPGSLAAERRLVLVKLALVTVRHSAGTVHIPRLTEIRMQEARRHYRASLCGPAYRGQNRALVEQQALLDSQPYPANNRAALRIKDSQPFIEGAIGSPLYGEERGYQRGQRWRQGFDCLTKLRLYGGRLQPQQAVLHMPEAAWRRLDEALDPVPHAARLLQALLQADPSGAEQRRDLILEAGQYLSGLVDAGARASGMALGSLERLHQTLGLSENHADQVACSELGQIINTLRRAVRADDILPQTPRS